jgi:hypothetical protein
MAGQFRNFVLPEYFNVADQVDRCDVGEDFACLVAHSGTLSVYAFNKIVLR